MKYRVAYHRDGWRRIAPRYPYAQSHDDFGEVQSVQLDLDDRTRLCVELMRKADASIDVTVARLEVRVNYRGHDRYRTAKFLEPDDLELVPQPPVMPS